MSVLVTGGAGYIGNHLVLDLADMGERVVVLDNLSTGISGVLPELARFFQGDVGDQHLVRRIIDDLGVDFIMHFAASVSVPESLDDPLAYYLNNTGKSCALIQTAVTAGIRQFVFSSTAAVYGFSASQPVAEDAPLKPLSPYGASKMMTEMILQDAARAHGLNYAILRYFNVAGADPKGRTGQSAPRAANLIRVACQTALGKRPYMEVFGTDYPTDRWLVRSRLHPRHGLDACSHRGADEFAAGKSERRFQLRLRSRVLGIAGHRQRQAHLRGAISRSGKVRAAQGDQPIVVAQSDKLREQLGWVPRWDALDTIITHALAWEKRLP